jgi:hypothetical protein
MASMNQQHFIPTPSIDFRQGVMEGRGTNAPSSASSVDFAMNNPYAFKSNFSGSGLGAASSGSASDYYDSNPNRVPAMQSETRHYSEFMMEGGAIDWAKYLGYIKKGVMALPSAVEKGVDVIDKSKKVLDTIKQLRETLKPKQAPAPKHEEIEYDEEPEEEYTKISRRKKPVDPKPVSRRRKVIRK